MPNILYHLFIAEVVDVCDSGRAYGGKPYIMKAKCADGTLCYVLDDSFFYELMGSVRYPTYDLDRFHDGDQFWGYYILLHGIRTIVELNRGVVPDSATQPELERIKSLGHTQPEVPSESFKLPPGSLSGEHTFSGEVVGLSDAIARLNPRQSDGSLSSIDYDFLVRADDGKLLYLADKQFYAELNARKPGTVNFLDSTWLGDHIEGAFRYHPGLEMFLITRLDKAGKSEQEARPVV